MLKGQRERASLRNFIGRNGVDPAGNLNDIRFEAFGPIVTVNGGNSLVISGYRERALLAAFLLHPGQRRSFDVLEETLWDGNRPKDVRHAIQTLVMRLRRHLPNGCIETTAGGYRIVVEQSAVDVHLFEALIEEARECVRANRGERAFDCYSLALRYGGNGDPWEDLGASEYGRSAKARVIECASYQAVFTPDGMLSSGGGDIFLHGGEAFGKVTVYGAGGIEIFHWNDPEWASGF